MPVNEEDTIMAQEVYNQLQPYMSTSAPRTKETLDNVLNLLYGAVNGKEESRQLSILGALVDVFKTKFNGSGFVQRTAVSAASGLIPPGAGKDFFDNVFPNSNKGNSEQRAKNLLKVVLLNSPLALESSASTSMTSRDSRSSPDATIFDEDEEIESLKTLEFRYYKKTLEDLSEFCKILLLTINKNKDLNIDQDIVKNLIKVDSNVFKELKHLKQQENFQPNVQNLLTSIQHAVDASIVVDSKVKNSDKIKQSEKKPILKQHVTYAARVLDALSAFMDVIFRFKEQLGKYFFGGKKDTNKNSKDNEEKKLLLFMEATGLKRKDVESLGTLRDNLNSNYETLRKGMK